MTEKSLSDGRFADIAENLKIVREKIAQAAVASGRNAEDIRLMAVSKTVEPKYINFAISEGIDLIGENKVQEFLSKRDELNLENCSAHLIGHLQTNKVKQIIGKVAMIQSVDSLRLASEISKRAEENNICCDVLVEVNVGGEKSKTGIAFDEAEELVSAISEMRNIKVCGLMSVPPFDADLLKTREFFSKMHRMFVDIRAKKLDNVNINILSLGMSGDFETAILEGSNLVRVGSAIFGARDYR